MQMEKSKQSRSFIVQQGRQAGIGMHVSSLPGAYGIGDIAESAFAFIDLLADIGIGVWQFLPTGPTAYGDSPYQPLSAFAGNANLIGIEPLIRDGLLREDEARVLSALPRDYTDYGQLIPIKRQLLEKAAERFQLRKGNGMLAQFEEFLHRNGESWLEDYALFRVLKTGHGERPWPQWDRELVHRESKALDRIRNQQRDALQRIRITQFLFDRQWRALKDYATGHGICLFGDMPIYIALDSSDAWAHPQRLLINAEGRPSEVAGVPPDYFSEDGQLWGNPLYDWGHHADTGFRWWIERMQHTMRQTHLVRIDHFRGFESFWSVPFGEETARNGEWLPGPGDALFHALEQALGSLPIVAEDLGVITPEVEALRLGHDLPGMVVLQFEAGDPDFEFEAIAENSVCYTGTHDNDTTVGWFRGNGDDTRSAKEIATTRKQVLKLTGGTERTIHQDMIRLAFSSNSTLAIAPAQDFLGLGSEARLNIPGTTLDNWRWRMRPGQWNRQLSDWVSQLLTDTSRSTGRALDYGS
jgi:4-alpha-glucanotransferase